MARVTVQDCLGKIGNRFDLVLIASKRARQLSYGKDSTLPWDNDKPTVMALREIADGNINEEILNEINAQEHAEESIVEEEELSEQEQT